MQNLDIGPALAEFLKGRCSHRTGGSHGIPPYIGIKCCLVFLETTSHSPVDRARKSKLSTTEDVELQLCVESVRSPKRPWRPNGVQIVIA